MDDAAGLEQWAADARAREAADARVRERWLRAQADEETSLAGILLALAERRATVVLSTAPGRRHRGVVTGVGVDFVAVEGPSGAATLIALSALAAVRVVADGAAPAVRTTTTGDQPESGALGVRLGDVLAQAAGQRPRLSVGAGAASVVGELRAMGSDVLTMRPDGNAAPVYVWLGSVSDISFLASG